MDIRVGGVFFCVELFFHRSYEDTQVINKL
jgi:hypothetical protein